MKLPAHASGTGWQPLTPRGVAAFAHAPLGRLLAVQFVFAALAAGATAWFLFTNWYPAISAAIRHLPARGQIQAGRLNWTGTSPQLLSEGGFLTFVVDLDHSGQLRSPAHVQVEFGRQTIRIFSLFGYLECAYPNPRGQIIAFNRPELEPWWGAWAPPLLWATAAITIPGLMASWALLAAVLCPAVRLIGFLANRALGAPASWKLAGAALLPGSVVMTLAIILYGLGILDPVQFLCLAGVHLGIGCLYCLISPYLAPPLPSTRIIQGNPFRAPAGRESAADKGSMPS